jgi:hypothetical protein
MTLNLQTINCNKVNHEPMEHTSQTLSYQLYIWKLLTTQLYSTEAHSSIFKCLTHLDHYYSLTNKECTVSIKSEFLPPINKAFVSIYHQVFTDPMQIRDPHELKN